MGLLDSLISGGTSKSATIKAQTKKIHELEKTVQTLNNDVAELRRLVSHLNDVVQYVQTAQQQLASDMGIIYENVKAVGEILTDHSAADEEKYFSWRWNIGSDDDDLPN